MKRTSFEDADCPVARSLDAIGDWWSLLIVRDALAGKRRFGEFQKGLGMAKNILAARLRKLVERGILEQVPASDGSAFSEYVLTERGRRLFPVLVALRQWGLDSLFENGEPYRELVDRRKGRPLAKMEVRAADGRVLRPEDTQFEALGS
jgi:DNA-binding HxlR family transcriptional regulator